MKRLYKALLLVMMAALCVASLAIITSAEVPSGPAGVNFANINSGLYNVTVETGKAVTGGFNVSGTYNEQVRYYQEHGDFNFTKTMNVNDGDMLRITWSMGTYGQKVLEYLNYLNQYYPNVQARAELSVNGGSRDFFWITPNYIEFHFVDGRYIRANTIQGFNVGDYKDTFVDHITMYFPFPQWQQEDGTYDPVVVHSLLVLNMTITQDVRVDFTTGYPGVNNQYKSEYVPFNANWLNQKTNESVDEAYERGYLRGVQEGGGEPIQAWSGFLLTAVTGFFEFELYPGFPLWGLLAVCISVPLLLWFLKMFVGG